MYRKVKPILDKNLREMDDGDEIDMVVEKAWEKIEKELFSNQALLKAKAAAEKASKENQVGGPENILLPSQLWTTVTIFISSTFRDMSAEREYIVKRVLPELADWAEKQGIRVVETDLRWGVPKHATSIDTIETCLGELEFIKSQTPGGQPLFLCLLGDRYGWIPNYSEIPEEVAQRYDWVENLSITHMEILQGALRCRNRNSLFCLRTPKFNEGLSPEHAEIFVDKGGLEKKQLALLKKKIGIFLPAPKEQIYTYDTKLKNTSEDPTKPEMDFSVEFGDKVLAFFKAAIERIFADRNGFEPPDEVEQENYNQRTYLERTFAATFGIENWTQEMVTYLAGSFTGENSSLALKYFEHAPLLLEEVNFGEEYMKDQVDAWPSAGNAEESGWKSHPICLLSEPGQGKTSTLAHVVKFIIAAGDVKVFFHFCGLDVSETSIRYALFLKRLLKFLLHVLESDKQLKDVTNEDELYQLSALDELLKQLQAKSSKKVILFIDSPENFSEVGSSIKMRWANFFPIRLPSNCTVVMSASTNSDLWIHYYLSLAEATMLRLPDSPLELRSIVATKYFESYAKKLDSEQLSALINKEGANLLLWLRLACEELRVFGNFRQVTSKIREFEVTLDGLLIQIFNRIIRESPDLPVAKFLRYLSITPQPLGEEDLPLLLGNPEKDERILQMDMARMRLILKPYILFAIGQRSIVLPFHQSMVKAAGVVCTPTLQEKMAAKRELAFFMTNYASTNSKFSWAYHIVQLLWESDCREELLHFFRFDQFGRNGLSGYRMEVVTKFRCPFPITAGMHTVPIRCCQPCSMKVDYELNGRFVDFCWVCKSRIISASDSFSQPALACANHREYPLNIGGQTCQICKIFRGPTFNQWVPMKVCLLCSRFGGCCHMSVEQSMNRYPLFANRE